MTIAFAAADAGRDCPDNRQVARLPGPDTWPFSLSYLRRSPICSSNTRLFMLFALTAVGTITTVYVGIFEPGQIGWGSTYTFDGILVATLVMVVVDTLIWPSPPEPRLLESIAADLDRTRRPLRLVGQRYLDPFSAPLPPRVAKSTLAPNLALLKSVEEHMKPRHSASCRLTGRGYDGGTRLPGGGTSRGAGGRTRIGRDQTAPSRKIESRYEGPRHGSCTERSDDILAGLPAGKLGATGLGFGRDHSASERFECADSAGQR